VDGIITHLDHTDEEARAAALAVGDQFRLHGATDEPHDQDAKDEVTGETPVNEPAGAGVGEPGAEAGDEAPSVDELFARIRAGTDDAGTGAGTGEGVEGAPTAGGETAGQDDAGTAEAEVAPGPDDELVARRDEQLAPVTARLSRTVKRSLGDDQNRLLDRLRSAPSLTVEDVLGPEDDHVSAFAAAARGHLAEAFAAGAAFAGSGASVATDDEAVEQSASGLAHVIMTMLRRQIEEGNGELTDRVGAAFREWRGERVERLAGDYATQAFSAGVAATGAEGKLRWVVTSASGCSDCEDNALAGAVSGTETFPTGHAHPPAHSGCRCLVTPVED
jgi:hypothetical protein